MAEAEEKHLRKRKLIEGRKPNFYIAKSIAQQVEQKADYTKNKAFDKKYYLDLIIKFIEQHGQMERKEADSLLFNKLPQWMSEEQKRAKIGNLLTELRVKEIIENKGSIAKSSWCFLKRD